MRFTGLWRNRDFLVLWAGQAVSAYGDQIAVVALPLLAINTLQATPLQMGILGAAGRLPFAIFALFVGVLADQWRRRPLLIGADLGRGLLLASLLIAVRGGFLGMQYLYAVAFLLGTLSVVFDIAYQSFVPSLVERNQLVEANSKIGMSSSIAGITGPGLAGLLVQWLTPTAALMLNAVSCVVSAYSLTFTRKVEVMVSPMVARQSLWRQIGTGLLVVLGNQLLWANAACRATYMFFASMFFAVYVLYLTHDLGLSPAILGLVLGAGAPGTFLAMLAVQPLAHAFGLGRTMLGAAILAGVGDFLIPLAGSGSLPVVPLLMLAAFLRGFWVTIYDLHQVSLRQAITPPSLLGRMTASVRFLIWGVTPFGALLGGWLGMAIGLRETLIIAAVGTTLAFLWLLPAPIRQLRVLPPVLSA